MKKLITLLAALAGLGTAVLPTLAAAQSSPSAYTSATRYDALGRVTGTIAPDPDGGGALKYLATRTTYDTRGNVTKVETGELSSWKSESIAPASWTGFTVHTTVLATYDTLNRKITERVNGSNGVTVSLTQYSYDNRGRLECTAVRMNPAVYGSLPASACSLGTEGSQGPDRITKAVYDTAGQVLQTRKAVGTPIEIADSTYSYTPNGQIKQVVDANGNRAELRYDGHDRQNRWVFPSKTRPSSFNDATPATAMSSAGALNNGDYEAYTYDDNGNRLSLRKRDGSTITYQYDNLNRVTRKIIPDRADLWADRERDVYYKYDLRSLQTRARFDSLSGPGQTNTYDGFGRITQTADNTSGATRNLTFQHDANSNRTQITYPDNAYWTYDYDGLNRLTNVRQGSSSIMGTAGYNNRGLPSQMDWHNQVASNNKRTYGYDPSGRLNSLAINLHGTSRDVSWGYARNPASQIASETQSNDSYSWDGHVDLNRAYTTNGLNQYTSAGGASFCYDANGNLTYDGASVYLYDVENRLVELRNAVNADCNALSYSGRLVAALYYDPLGRLYRTQGDYEARRYYLYDGNALVAEYDGSGTLLHRYIHGSNAAADDPLVWSEGSGISNAERRYLHADPRGSIVAVTDYAGVTVATNSYDEYGIPSASNEGRFQYTGQTWQKNLGMYYYKARIYSPTLGRFLQTDPIGYDDGMNIYAYVGNDPINNVDPTGLYDCEGTEDQCQIVDEYVDQLEELSNNEDLSNRERRALRSARRALGKKGGKGPTIKVDTALRGRGAVTNRGNIIVNTDNISLEGVSISNSNGTDQFSSIFTVGAATLAHELVHQRHRISGFLGNWNVNRSIYSEYIGYGIDNIARHAGGLPQVSSRDGAIGSCSGRFSETACENAFDALAARGYTKP